MNKIFYTLIAIIGFHFTVLSQTGEIQGKVVDDKGDPASFAQVMIVEDEAGLKPTGKGAKADRNGLYTIKGLSPGKYNVMAKVLGKPKEIETDVQVYGGRPTTLNLTLGGSTTTVKAVNVVGARVNKTKLIDVFTPKENTMTAADVKESAVRDVNSLAGSTGQVVQSDVGKELNIAGGRDNSNVYFIDGVKVTGSSSVPPSSIAQLEVITSGVPAKYGDATGGVIAITTKGPSNKFAGAIEGLTSSYLDAFGYNLVGGNLSGPIFRRKNSDTTLPLINGKRPKGDVALGFFISGEYQTDKDAQPQFNSSYKIKDAKWADLLANPYDVNASGTGLFLRQSLVNANDIETLKYHVNANDRKIRLTGKLDWKVNKLGTNITVNARYIDEWKKDYIDRYSLFNVSNIPVVKSTTMSGFLRLYQPLFNSEKQNDKIIRNTTLQLQADIERVNGESYSEVGNMNPFAYGYIGKFEESRVPNVKINSDPAVPTNIKYGSGANDFVQFGPNVIVNSTTANGVTYTPGTYNQTAAQLTQKFIELYTSRFGAIRSVASLDSAGALVNGKRSDQTIIGLYYPMGRVYNGMGYGTRDQYRISGYLNFDLVNKKSKDLNKHTIEIGFEAEQRYQSNYSISPNSIWNTANTSINSHLALSADVNYNPLLIMNGGKTKMRLQDYVKQNTVIFNEFDTIVYDNIATKAQTNFSRNLRQSLGVDSLANINIFALTPTQLKLNMFSADEMLASSITPSYIGYTYDGNKLSNSTTFSDFFTKKNSQGLRTRDVAPYSPFYAAGYIQDRFQLKEIAFNVGLRVDYYNSNTYTFIDPYVPVGAKNISEAGLPAPSNISKDAIVYVDNAESPTKAMGYRLGNQWYDAKGNQLNGPDAIISATGGQAIPYFKAKTAVDVLKRDITSSVFDPNLMFRKADGIFTIMPRLNFSFKIDSNSLLFAHYDVMSQRPEANLVNALDYWNLLVKNSGFINNPNLRAPKTSDLELGFKQRLSARSALTLNFFYREYIDQIQITKLNGAYPTSYLSFANSDFSTVKGFGIAYELRRTKNLKIKTNYTMQFAEGTGSNSQSQLGFINANQGNIKVIAPLSFDVRHNFNLNLNYRFAGGNNYEGPTSLKKVFQNSGINIDVYLRSGYPYSLQSNITPTANITNTDRAITMGDMNSAIMPWRYNVNLKVDKDFYFKIGRRPDSTKVDNRREFGFNLYFQVTNLLNSENVLSVNRYTGSPYTDGYLSSPAANSIYQTQEAIAPGMGQSFRDLYNIALNMNAGDKLVRPRVMQLGGILTF